MDVSGILAVNFQLLEHSWQEQHSDVVEENAGQQPLCRGTIPVGNFQFFTQEDIQSQPVHIWVSPQQISYCPRIPS